MPPQAPFEYFVEKVGLGRFNYVPGYVGRDPGSITEAIAVERIAWAIRRTYRREPTRKRGYRGIYNEVVFGRRYNAFKSDVRQAGIRLALRVIKESLLTE